MTALSLLIFILIPQSSATAQPDEDGADWDVTTATASATTVTIDTVTGTWMNIDVSPNGTHLVFDLLGDIYELPLTGGEARPVTTGHGWDFQPRYTPDGSRLIFTSDQGGGDNIWSITLDGGDLTQLTTEDIRLLTSPAVAPNGEYFVARKHFTGPRSLGAGEIWTYDFEGGTGRPLTHRPNQQHDLGEPAFSPDGHTLYYSYDATAGDIFEYGKDANKGIYAIDALDLTSGRINRVAGGPGGAIRPTPSPDGQSLAFIRRVRGVSVLMLKDLASGAETTIARDLERDLQETWAVHGVYPTIDFTPDGKSVIYWAGGKIHNVTLATGAVTTIPFHVTATHTIEPAIRFAVDVAPDSVNIKMIRDISHAPNDDAVLFSALGHLYIQEGSDARPRRLTTDDNVIEFDGAFSRDGRDIVYAVWSDTELGSIRTRRRKGRKSRPLSIPKGHYTSPQFSPDGHTIAYQKVRGGDLLPRIWSADPGIYVYDRQSQEHTLVRRSGHSPHFGADSNRLFFQTTHDGNVALASQRLSDTTPEHRGTRVHAFGKTATSMRVSPNGQLIAIREDYKAHVTKLPLATEPRDVGVDAGTAPHQTVTTSSADNLHFSADSQTLHWSLGNTLYAHTIDFGNDSEPTPQKDSIDLSVSKANHRFTGAIVNVNLIPMTDEPIPNGVIIWTGDRIIAVGPADETPIPPHATVFDGQGATLIPGLIDVHAHGSYGTNSIIPQQSWRALSYLSFGVTTIHDPSNDNETIFAAAERQRAGLLLAPRIFSTGKILYGAEAVGTTATINSLDDALFHLGRQKVLGAISVKSYNQPRREQRQMVLKAAHELGIMVVPEGGALFNHNMTQVVDGHTGVEHAVPLANLYDDVDQLWGATQVGYTPTLGVAYGGLEGEQYWYANTDVWANKRLTQFVPPWRIDGRARRPAHAPLSEYNHFDVARAAKGLSNAGVRVNIGGHGQREGLAPHWEIWMLEQGGFTPLQALQAATINGAQYLGLDNDIGSLEVGKLADFVVIDGNPLVDIRATENVLWTVLAGVLYDAASMEEKFPNSNTVLPNSWSIGHGIYPTEPVSESNCASH